MKMHDVLIFTLAVTAFVASVLFVVFSPRRIVALCDPRVVDDNIIDVDHVAVPQIEAFDHYYGDEGKGWRYINPFLPYRERMNDVAKQKAAEDEPDYWQPALPPTEPIEEKRQTPDHTCHVPALESRSSLLQAHSYVARGERAWLRVRVGRGSEHRLARGETVAGWRWLGVDKGRAVFSDPSGERLLVSIGTADRPMTVVAVAGRSQ